MGTITKVRISPWCLPLLSGGKGHEDEGIGGL